MLHPLIVLKFGGSVLLDEAHVHAAAREVGRFVAHGHRVVAVVSALEGVTDALVARAGALARRPDPYAKALLVATGELASAAMLGLALREAGRGAAVLDSAAAGIVTEGEPLDAMPVSIDGGAVLAALAESGVVVLPGFTGRDRRRRVTLLGRGGSDMTALFIAHALRSRCRLVKDVAGLYERDPALPGPAPRLFATLGWERALELDGGIVQHKAIRWAAERRLGFEVAAVGSVSASLVGEHPEIFRASEVQYAA